MSQISFKTRVKNTAIEYASIYQKVYVAYEYLLCSNAFVKQKYYIIDAKADNYAHLLGVHLLINPSSFYQKCIDKTLDEGDFDFLKKNQSVKSVKGSVRRKLKVLPDMMKLFDSSFLVQETFVKNRVICSFATTDNKCTIGFIEATKAKPKTLLKGNELCSSKMNEVELVLRKKSGEEKYREIIIGDESDFCKYKSIIEGMIDLSKTVKM